ncbi:MAG TPA: autotransporter-associated beta strand repeat-containing protein [Verrucomicrobiae bacterium]|nr:autotransporter-associated beta strand repeat-containing protein [Verrucomicrobiae bacterium]
MKIAPSKTVVACLTLLLSMAGSRAAQVTLNASDAVGTSSFNTAGHWSNSQAPSAANDYNTAGFFMRTPGDGTTSDVFAGASLTLGVQNTSGGNNGSLLEKFSGAAGATRTLTINNFTNSANSLIRSGGTAGAIIHIQGNVYAIAGTSAINADQCIWIIDSPLIGGDSIILTNFANNANDHVAYTATNSAFTGSLYLTAGNNTSSWSLEMDNVNSVPGNPSTLNPGQITFLNLGQLRDIIGCAFTNSNGGFTFAANAIINTSTTTLIGEPITDKTNGVSSLSSLTSSGAGTLILSNANNNYTGGTTISAGTVQLGVANALPVGPVSVTGVLDLNTFNDSIDALNGAGTVETSGGGSPTLTIGANGGSGTFSGSILGSLNVVKTGAGTETFSAGYTYNGTTTVSGGTLSLTTSGTLPTPAGDVAVNGAALTVNVAPGIALPANNLVLGNNSTLNFTYGLVTVNPTAPAINATGSLPTPGANIVINISATGLKVGTFTLIKYTGTALGSIANFSVNLPPGVFGNLVNNTGSDSIDLAITQVPTQLSWNGVGGANWDLSTLNWSNLVANDITNFHQFDNVLFDDTLTNDFVNPQPTNINVTTAVFVAPIVVNSTLPYSFSGPGEIDGTSSLLKTNTGSLTLLTSNNFTGGVIVGGGTLILTNDDALGTNSSAVTLNGGNLQYNGTTTNNIRAFSILQTNDINVSLNNTVQLGGALSGTGHLDKQDNGTLVLAGRTALTSGSDGNLFVKFGAVTIPSGGSITNGYYVDIGQDTNDTGTLNITGGSLGTASDFNVGDVGASVGTVNISSGSLIVNALFVGSANAAGSTASGTVNQTGGTVTQLNTAVGECVIGGRTQTTSIAGVGVYNMNGGVFTPNGNVRLGAAGIGTLNQNAGTINAILGVNIARLPGSVGTNNLNGGLLATFNMATSTGTNAVFNFNGGTLQAQFAPANPWFSGAIQANVLAGGAIIDSSSNNAVVTTPLLAGSPNGGLTKLGSGTLTLDSTNSFTGPITNNAGILFLNSTNGTSTYPGAVQINAGTLQITPTTVLNGSIALVTNSSLAVIQSGSSTVTMGNVTFNGQGNLPGGSLTVTLTGANVPSVPFINAGTLTLNGTNTINVSGNVPLGVTALLKYTGAIAGSGNITNLVLPQGAGGFLSNNAASSTLFVVVTNAGPGLVWTGTNNIAGKTNLWDILSTTNWLVGGKATWYQQFSVPGDAVTFNDSGSGTVILSNSVAPASLVISNTTRTYTFSGPGTITGQTGLLKLGTNTATVNLTNNNYTGNTTISNGTVKLGSSAAISASAPLVMTSSGTLEVNGFNQTVSELTGAGLVDNAGGNPVVLTLNGVGGGTWAGNMQDHGSGIALVRNGGNSTWFVSGTNNLNNGTAFTVQNQVNSGTVIVTNGGSLISSFLEFQIGNNGNATVTVASGSLLAVSNNMLTLGTNGGNGTLIVNGGTVIHGGNPGNGFGQNNNIEVGGLVNGTGTLIVNGGQVLNSQSLTIAQAAGSTGSFFLNGGVVQANVVQTGNSATATNYFNGGTLQATTNSVDFIQVPSLIMSNGLVLDDNGFTLNIVTAALQPGDTFNGGLVKKGSGTVYLDSPNSYFGTTVVTNGTLGGSGSIFGPLAVGPAGNIAPGDAGAFAGNLFTINGDLTLQGSATFRVSVNGGFSVSDLLQGITTATYGGTLVVSNETSDLTVMTNGQSFQLFSASSGTGNFANIVGSPGAGLSYVFNPATGVLSVTNAVVKSVPHFTHLSVSGTTLSLSATNGTPNGQYVLLGSTNVALPIAQWTPLLTNTFDGSGNLNLTTNIVNPAVLHEFYLLLQ